MRSSTPDVGCCCGGAARTWSGSSAGRSRCRRAAPGGCCSARTRWDRPGWAPIRPPASPTPTGNCTTRPGCGSVTPRRSRRRSDPTRCSPAWHWPAAPRRRSSPPGERDAPRTRSPPSGEGGRGPGGGAMGQHGSSILWLESAEPRGATDTIDGRSSADVVIVGGGFTGLWTAHHLIRRDPGLEVVVIDAHRVGDGASGRNGGFAMTLLDFSLHRFARNWGDDAAATAHRAVARSVEAIAATVREESLDCDLEHTGLLRVA